ncbi:MAG TPA: hypothetical protein VKG79_17605 [Bryobacteraceae bacterium]|nr:hypothetical protein [Bryobacteraceae bacterium]
MRSLHVALSCCLLAAPALAQTISGGSCNNSNLMGTYSLTLSGRVISASGVLSGAFQSVGSAMFDGNGNVTMTGTYNTNQAVGKQFTYSGTYTLPSNCLGSITLTQGSSANFGLVVWSNGQQFDITGSDPATSANPNSMVYSGNGSSIAPPACATASLSGAYTFDLIGSTLSGGNQKDAAVESGVFQFDGQGNVTTATYMFTTSQPPMTTTVTAMGTYTVGSNCLGSATLTDSNGAVNSLNFALAGPYGQNPKLLAANPGFVSNGQTHAAFTNPTQSIANVASYAVNATPPGSVFALFGVNLATKPAGATSTTLPTTLLNTTVTVNGIAVPLFYVDTGQIDAQMPWEIPGNSVATVIVKNGNSTSNAAAVYVPASATPGISAFGNNRAVVVNANGVTNDANAPAAVGDEVVVYFTGGGPVNAAGKLVTGSPDPSGLSPVSGANPTITVGGMSADIKYIGLTPGSIGLYQANFIVPQIAKGTYPVVITIAGTASNSLGGPQPNPVMTISN